MKVRNYLGKLASGLVLVGASLLPSCWQNSSGTEPRERYSLELVGRDFSSLGKQTLLRNGYESNYIFLFDRNKDGKVDEMVRTDGYENATLATIANGLSCVVEHKVAEEFMDEPLFKGKITRSMTEFERNRFTDAANLFN